MRASVPAELADAAHRSAAPAFVHRVAEQVGEQRPDALARLVDDAGGLRPSGRAFVALAAASNALARLCVADEGALSVLDDLEEPVDLAASADAEALVRAKRRELLRIAARDLLGLDDLAAVGRALADLADAVLGRAVVLGGAAGSGLCVVGMGKLGGRELNYASDVDVLFVGGDATTARAVLGLAGRAFRIDADLRPEGRSGPLTRSLEGYRAYWQRWAQTWEFQALIKARPVAGDAAVGKSFATAAADAVWGRTIRADELAEVRAMKARTEALAGDSARGRRELKRSPGGIRDIEFAVQLLQLVHGRHDPDVRDPSTLGALGRLAVAGYVDEDDAVALADAYAYLRTVEHRVQLVEEEQTHAVPADPDAHERLARVLGYEADAASTASARFDDDLRACQSRVRTIHERLFFRPLLESFAALPAATARPMTPDAVATRLAAFGFADAARTRAAVVDLAGGLRRSSRLMEQMLPLLLDWLSLTPDPDLGLLGLRNLLLHPHHRALVASTFRESPEAARRVCLLLGSSRTLAEALEHNPELIARIDDDSSLAPASRDDLVRDLRDRSGRAGDDDERRSRLVRARQDQLVAVAAADLLDASTVEETGNALSVTAEALLEAALGVVGADHGFCVVGLGRFGGSELSYASDLDILLVHDGLSDPQDLAESLVRFVHGPSPAGRVATLDLALRPEGAQGPLSRDPQGYRAYFARWAETWERLAMMRARVVAGDVALGGRFIGVVDEFVWQAPFTDEHEADIRRMKARIERERIPAREDPQFHLKLGKGSLSDVEWTVQLLQLRHRMPDPSVMGALGALQEAGVITDEDADSMRDAYRFCEHTRNRWHLVGALAGGTPPGDALPTETAELSRLARSLGTSAGSLRENYRRVTRRCRRVVERLFYGIDNG
jgi:[glutamine synthetase] adenylyltransferase / [glutamine synthetase]-adenylyl-L-tyrosine phosphorylase